MWLLHQLSFFNHWSYNPFASRRRTAVLAITGPSRISEGDDSASCFWSFWYVIVFIVLYYIFLDHFVGIWNVFVIWDKDLIVTPSISSVWLYEFLNEKENVGLNKSFSTPNAHTLWINAWISSKVAPVKPPSSIKLNVTHSSVALKNKYPPSPVKWETLFELFLLCCTTNIAGTFRHECWKRWNFFLALPKTGL